MSDPHGFLWSWLRDGSEMFLAGSWLDVQLEHLYRLAEQLRPALDYRRVGGHGVRVLCQTERHCIHIGRN